MFEINEYTDSILNWIKNAMAGNRTRILTLEGSYSTTEPPEQKFSF